MAREEDAGRSGPKPRHIGVPFTPALTVAGFCRDYGISRSKAFEEIKSGRLQARKVGSRTLIGREDAQLWFATLPRR